MDTRHASSATDKHSPEVARRAETVPGWLKIPNMLMEYLRTHGSSHLSTDFTLEKVEQCPFTLESTDKLKNEVVDELASRGYGFRRTTEDCTVVSVLNVFQQKMLKEIPLQGTPSVFDPRLRTIFPHVVLRQLVPRRSGSACGKQVSALSVP